MNQPKFRAYMQKSKVMLYDFWIRSNEEMIETKEYEKGPYALMQSTDKPDKNGKTVFESDILIKTRWLEWGGKKRKNGHEYKVAKKNTDPTNWEVIGNIFEHPDILDGIWRGRKVKN